jgi:hypothetical protein
MAAPVMVAGLPGVEGGARLRDAACIPVSSEAIGSESRTESPMKPKLPKSDGATGRESGSHARAADSGEEGGTSSDVFFTVPTEPAAGKQ